MKFVQFSLSKTSTWCSGTEWSKVTSYNYVAFVNIPPDTKWSNIKDFRSPFHNQHKEPEQIWNTPNKHRHTHTHRWSLLLFSQTFNCSSCSPNLKIHISFKYYSPICWSNMIGHNPTAIYHTNSCIILNLYLSMWTLEPAMLSHPIAEY